MTKTTMPEPFAFVSPNLEKRLAVYLCPNGSLAIEVLATRAGSSHFIVYPETLSTLHKIVCGLQALHNKWEATS